MPSVKAGHTERDSRETRNFRNPPGRLLRPRSTTPAGPLGGRAAPFPATEKPIPDVAQDVRLTGTTPPASRGSRSERAGSGHAFRFGRVGEAVAGTVRVRKRLRCRGPLHDAGIAHRYVKPSGVTFPPPGVAEILDFGLVRAALGVTGPPG